MTKEFKHTYTRDRQIITQQAWLYGCSDGMEELINCKFSFKFSIVFYVNEGAIEIWENREDIKQLKEKLDAFNSEDKNFCKKVLTKFNEKLDAFFKSKWEKGFTEDLSELKEVAQTFVTMTPHYVYLWYTVNSISSEQIRDLVVEWRNQDVFFEKNAPYIQESLKKIYPKLNPYHNLITIDEIDNPPNVDTLKARSKHWVLIPGKVSEIISLNEFEEKNPEYHFLKMEIPFTDLVKGQVGFPGIVKGPVKVLRTTNQVKEVQDNDIIVSPMTIPEFLPAMKKAAAFVTDEGSSLCHAAIVARELKKPCVIGTKIATQVLKDGDLVEVDAEKGVVRKI